MISKTKTICALFLLAGATAPAYAAPVESNSPSLAAQQSACTGIVKDANGEPIIGASVVVKGTTKGAMTGLDGDFTLANVKPGSVIQISYIGYQSTEITWNGGAIEVTLKEDTAVLEDVVVVGFGTQKKANLTGAVSAVSSKEISSRPVNSTIEALQGIVPGMNVSTSANGGSLKSNKTFNIRGANPLGNTLEPLVLIDGMEGDMNALNPQDIENISVLKDAAAASIYGSRAPGGVILITTKKGSSGRTVVNYNNSFRWNSPLNMPHMADSYSFALAINDQMIGGGQAPMYSATKLQQILDYREGKTTQYMWDRGGRWNAFDDPARQDIMPVGYTDWLHEHFGTSFTHEHSLSVNGGNDKTQFYISANFLDQDGALRYGEDGKQRYSVSGKINHKITDWLKIGYSIRFNRTDYKSSSFASAGDNVWNQFYFDAYRFWPVIPLHDPNGNYTEASYVNHLENGGTYNTQSDVISQQLSLILEPIKNWKTTIEMNYRVNNNFDHTDWQTVYAFDVNNNPYVAGNATSSVYEYAYKSNFFNPNIYSEYSFDINEAHNFKVMLGFQSELFKQRNITARRDGVMAGIPTINTTSTNPRVGGSYDHWATAGFFGRLNYDYKGRYLVEANLRYDGTSRFLKDQRWNWFPSFSLGWNIAREEFFEGLTDKISTLKLRGSFGELGNQNTGSWYPFYSTLSFSPNAGSWLVNGRKPNIASMPGLISATLGWEKTQTVNVGFDLAMLSNRLTVNFDWFRRNSLDLVGPGEELPVILGTSVPSINNLNTHSTGWEVQVSWRDKINDFNYGATLSLSDNQVIVDKYPNPSKNLSSYYEGRKVGDIWGYTTVGIAKTDEEMKNHLASVNQSQMGSNWGAGDIMYADIDGDGKISSGDNTLHNPGDRKIIGNTTPRYQFGLNLDASWKGFDAKVFFQGVLKRDYMPGSGSTVFWGAVGYWQTNYFEQHLDYFRPADNQTALGPNVDGYLPRPLENGRNRYAQTRYLQDASYCRLKNVTIGYTLPQNISTKAGINNLRFFVSGENLATFTKLFSTFDPETIGIGGWDGCTYPLSKTISVGLSATF